MKTITNTCDTHHPALSNFNILLSFRFFLNIINTVEVPCISLPNPIPLPPSPEGTTIQNLLFITPHASF